MDYAPVVMTVFNRPMHTEKALRKLIDNELAKKTDIYIFSDGPRKPEDEPRIAAVRKIIHNISGFRNVYIEEYRENMGLAKSTIYCMSKVINERDKIIGMEDDLVAEKYFLNVMNQMLDYYEEDERIGSVTSFMLSTRLVKFPKTYTKDIFFNLRPVSSGWGMWKDRWNKIDWEMNDYEEIMERPDIKEKFNMIGSDFLKIIKAYREGGVNSWSIRWIFNNLKYDLVTVGTTKSYLDTIGYDSSGIHCVNDESYFFSQEELATKRELDLFPYTGELNYELVKRFGSAFSFGPSYIKRKLYSKLGVLIK